jgi:hypothetical protein
LQLATFKCRSNNIIDNSSADDLQFGLQKSAMANKVMDICNKESTDPKSITTADIATIQSYINTYAPDSTTKMFLPKTNSQSSVVPMSLTGDGGSKYLGLPGQVQTTSYYCGPATAYAILEGRGISTTQAKIASRASTTTNGTIMSNLLDAMNSYSGTSGKTFRYAKLSGPGSNTDKWYATMTADAITTLIGGYGVVYNVHMVNSTGSARLAGYSTMVASNIYHYVAGEGYDSTSASNRICYYYDSNNEKTFTTRHQHVTFTTMAILTDDMSIGF